MLLSYNTWETALKTEVAILLMQQYVLDTSFSQVDFVNNC